MSGKSDDGLMPLSEFSAEMRERIDLLANAEEPPPKWITVGGGIAQIRSRAWAEWHLRRGQNPERQREKIPLWMKDRVIERDGNTCQLCGEDVLPEDRHLDHIQPVSFGGKNTVDNLQVSHSVCNLRKGNRA